MTATIPTILTIIAAPDPLARLAQLDLDPRRHWLRAHQRAVARCRRLSAAYEYAWRSGQSTWDEWEQIGIARRREAFCYRCLCAVMNWR